MTMITTPFRNSFSIKSHFLVFLLFFSIAFVLRFFSFFPSVIDHDESTYLVIGNEILKGKLLYTDATDIKPVGIFYIVAAFIRIFGRSIFGFRVFTTFIIAATSFFIYKTKLAIGHLKNVALASGIIYIFFLSVWTHFGVSPNTVHFFNLFSAGAVYLLFSSKKDWKIPVMGLLFGLGFLIKIVVAFDFVALILFLFITDLLDKKFTFNRFVLYFSSGITFLIPFALVNLVFYLTGHFDDFYQVNYVAFRNYAQQLGFFQFLFWILGFFVRFLPLSIFFFWSLALKMNKENILIRERLLVLIWITFCLLSNYLPGKLLAHYLIQLMLPASFLAGNIMSHEIKKPVIIKNLFSKKLGYPLLILFIIGNVILQKKDYFNKEDCPREIANYLELRMNENDIVYTGNASQIIYFLLNTSPPTKYVHSSLLFAKEHIKALNIDPDEVFQSILEKKPSYILIHDKGKNETWRLINTIREKYSQVYSFTNCRIQVYQRNTEE